MRQANSIDAWGSTPHKKLDDSSENIMDGCNDYHTTTPLAIIVQKQPISSPSGI